MFRTARTSLFRFLLLLWTVSLSTGAWAQTPYVLRAMEIESGDELTVRVFESAGEVRLLWIPSEFGLGPGETDLAHTLAERGVEVWQPNLHSSYFLVPGRQSYATVPVTDLAGLIEAATADARAVYLLAAGRGAALILEAANLYQQAHGTDTTLTGAILLHPNMLAGIAEAGKASEYLPITGATALPLYIFQPVFSAKHYYLKELSARFAEGGAAVYTHSMQDVSDGFASRAEITPPEEEARKRLPGLITRAMELLAAAERPGSPPPSLTMAASGARESVRASLQPIPHAPPAPFLAFHDLSGRTHRLEDYAGRVVLLNFWATWCPPCVEELPSLERLRLALSGEPFAIVTVDVGEKPEQVGAFLERHNIEIGFPVLLDPQGRSVDDWRVLAFPTSFLLDRDGRLRHGLFGAIEWDGPETIGQIRALLAEPAS